MTDLTPDNVPQHIAIIMDGNRRWAKQRGLHPLQGHEYVANTVIRQLVERCIELKIPYLTLWAFSTENWKRDSKEVEGILKLFRQAFEKSSRELHEMGVKLHSIGNLTRFPEDIQKSVAHWKAESQDNANITVTFALNYGGRDEIMRAMKKMIDLKLDTDQLLSKSTIEDFEACLDTTGLPDPDLIIRPGGEQRLSGFMPWQSVYSEFYFTEVLMPDFGPAELDKAVAEYQRRQRRFGG